MELHFAAAGAVEWALNRYEEAGADFSDCMHTALVSLAGEAPMWAFDKAASKLTCAALLA